VRAAFSAVFVCLAACEGTVGDLDMKAAEQPPEPRAPGMPSITTFDCTPEMGAVPFQTSCTVLAKHPDARPIKCTLGVSDSRANPIQAADCSAAITQPLSFDVEGTYTLTLTVGDDNAMSAVSMKTLVVAPRPNQAPVVTSFVATPATGTAPLNTVFTWAVTDPDADALTCSIDVGNDGSVEYPGLDCSKLTQSHTLTAAGTAEVLFVVTDSRGLSAQSVVTISAKLPVGDVRIGKVEWGQVVVSENPRLVQGKPALLRLHVLADKAGLTGVTVDAEGFTSAGVSLGKLTLAGPATPPIAEVPADLTKQWTGTVPAAWMEVGLEIRVKVDPADALPETDETNNAKSVKPVVGKGNTMQFTAVPVVNGGRTGTLPDPQPILTRMWPLKSVVVQNRAPYTFAGTLSGGDTTAWGNLLQAIANVRQADGSSRNYYGYVGVSYGSGIAGIGYIGQEAATGRDDSQETVAHELGHNMGRQHAPCGGVAGPDQSYPYAGAKIGSWGYDATNKQLLNPASYTDLMGYCNPAWTSDYNYKAVQTFLEAAPFITGGGASMYAPVLLVAGAIHANGELSLQPVHRLVAAQTADTDGAWAVVLHTVDGRELVHPFSPVELSEGDDRHFNLLLPDPGALASMEVVHGTQVVRRIAALGGDAPLPTLTRVDASSVKLTWDARRFASATLAHLADNGTRTTLSLWMSGGEAVVRTDGLSGGHFEVSLSDGLASTRRVLVNR
jgi:PKD repeat protein